MLGISILEVAQVPAPEQPPKPDVAFVGLNLAALVM